MVILVANWSVSSFVLLTAMDPSLRTMISNLML